MLENSSKKGFLLVKIDFVFFPTTFIVYRFLVHCRVGSLENAIGSRISITCVHCRVGSLEITHSKLRTCTSVHCRVGSLEISIQDLKSLNIVHCRVGSLENHNYIFFN